MDQSEDNKRRSPEKAVRLLKKNLQAGESWVNEGGVSLHEFEAWIAATADVLNRSLGADSSLTSRFGRPQRVQTIRKRGMTDEDLERNRLFDVDSWLPIIRAAVEHLEDEISDVTSTAPATGGAPESREVFVVHGHDQQARAETSLLLTRLGLEPVVLGQKTNEGRTIIEKFEAHSNVGFAVVLMTGDDRGGILGQPHEEQQRRARQNVILELGYFVGKLGRGRVCTVYETGVELPSDYHGVVYIPLDPAGHWKTQVAREMKAAGLPVDMNDLE